MTTQQPLLVPAPVSMDLTGGERVFAQTLKVFAEAGPADAVANTLCAALCGADASAQRVSHAAEADVRVVAADLSWSGQIQNGITAEAYEIVIDAGGLTLRAATPAGLRMGMQSVRQLLLERPRSLPHLTIRDYPRFAWRGLHLDVGRHFFSAEDVKRFIDLASLHRLNSFHWHLTEDQGWRLPVPGYPRLTEVAAWRDQTVIGHERSRPRRYDGVRHGGAYTREEIVDVVAFAESRGVTVVPEVDVPGHVQALLTAYPEFGTLGTSPGVRQHWGISHHVMNLEPVTLRFFDALIDTLCELFPGPYIHFGGDEAPTHQWSESQRIQQRMAELGITSDHGVQAWMLGYLAERLTARQRKLVGWDEILDAGCPTKDAIVMYWRSNQPRHLQALEKGHPVVLAPGSHTYFDHYQTMADRHAEEPLAIGGELPLQKVYDWQPLGDVPQDRQDRVLGGQAQLWTEYIPTRDHLDYMTWPRACALSEVLWLEEKRAGWDDFLDRMIAHAPRLERLGVRGRPLEIPQAVQA